MKLVYQQAPAQPLTYVNLVLPRSGACLDPTERQGLSRLLLRQMFMGADGLDRDAYTARLERLGATCGHGLANDHTVLKLACLTENLDAALDLFLGAVHRPNLDEQTFAQLQEELVSTWRAERDESKQLRAHEVYMHRLYGGAPTGHQPDGTEGGLRACTPADVREHFAHLYGGAEPILAVLSDLPRPEIEARVQRRLELPAAANGRPWPWDAFSPQAPPGRRVTLVPDADTQTDEMLFGGFTVPETDPDWHVHRVIAWVFGGDMNSRLFRVVRGERGLSYGANCWYESAQGRAPRDRVSPFTLYTFPSAEHSAEAASLVLELYEQLVQGGITDEELALARQALINSHPFRFDTPQKLLGLEVSEALYGLHTDADAENRRKLESVTPAEVLRVLRASHDPARLRIVLLGDPGRLEPMAAALPAVAEVETLSHP